jgi:flagellar M-ring protein FliF
MLEQWKTIWTNLPVRQRVAIGAVIVVVAAAVFGMTKWQHERDFKPLYTGMSAEDAGAVVAKLKESGVEFRISDDGTVSAPSSRQAELRLELASAGLPKTGRIGFELFDKANLGMTDFAEQVNYRRALEGELERSVRAITEVEQARVHITFPKDSVFLESRTPGKASVLLKLRNGAKLPQQNVLGIAHMVASAVEGLTPDSVAVMDVHGNLMSRPKNSQDGLDLSDEAIEYRRRVEKDLLTKINSTLEPLLGAERFRAGVSVECDFTSGEQSEETFDPERSVMTSSQKTEETSTSTNASGGGIPGTASNLPRPTGRTPGSGASTSKRSETIAFQTSKTVRRTKIPQGTVKRLSASILVDQAVRWEGSGAKQKKIVTPPSAETVRAIRVLVSGAIGLQPDRGDQLVVESLPFEATLQTAPPATEAPLPAHRNSLQDLDTRMIVFIGSGIAALLAGAYLLLRKSRTKGRGKITATPALAKPAQESAKALPAKPEATSERIEAAPEAARISQQALKMDKLLGSVRKAVSDDPSLVAGVVRSWLEERPS